MTQPRMTAAELRERYDISRSGRAVPKSPQGERQADSSPGARVARQEAGRTAPPAVAPAKGTDAPRPHKFAATKTEGPDGAGGVMLYDSAKGAKLARRLEDERRAGTIVSFAPEVSVIVGELGGKSVRHRVDMLVVHAVHEDGTFTGQWVEAKGFDAPVGRRKRLALERRLGTRVRVV